MSRLPLICFVFAGLMALLLFAFNHLLSRYAPAPFYAAPAKVWAHRGYFAEGLPENSIAAFAAAFDRGAAGTELDIFYDRERSRFLVTHDAPADLTNPERLTLDRVFAATPGPRYYWLDFKNLEQLEPADAARSAELLRDHSRAAGLSGFVIVESTHAENLAIVSRAGLATSYWIGFAPNESWLRYRYHVGKIRLAIRRGRFSAISMHHDNFTARVERDFANMPVHLFTVNDDELLRFYGRKKSVKVLLTDLDRYRISFGESNPGR